METGITVLDLLPVVWETEPSPYGPNTCRGTYWRPICLGSRFDTV
ncbi:hypothetical protein [Planomonospora algeriensis]